MGPKDNGGDVVDSMVPRLQLNGYEQIVLGGGRWGVRNMLGGYFDDWFLLFLRSV